uniref:Ci-LF-8 receptor n=2 Tax=Ciona intestinalis TaxID=7719 RepID=A0A1W2W8Y7_CIOIN|nr:uncharacterized protein LOC100181044 isoform X1 [Ciona intestinalis]BBC53705.1 Ci-LF-8 receptor [Ciona intestinalis]|eukprot:XP_026696534.1 uncharacterized protein LOC100181044 isoform X1 [Ciona intestinalis]
MNCCVRNCSAILLLILGMVTTINCSSHVNCQESRGNAISNRQDELHCCNETFNSFSKNWHNEADYLTETLQSLKDWSCPQYNAECSKPTFNFNDFTALVYHRSCNRTLFESRCLDSLMRASSARGVSGSIWSNLLRDLRTFQLSQDELRDPCIQVALYDAAVQERGKYGYYHEMKRVFIPFCKFIWCGLDAENIHDHSISAWLCIPTFCRTNIIISIVVCSILSIWNVVANSIVLVVFFKQKRYTSSAGIYKLSIALADIMVGLFIYPTFANNISKITMTLEKMGPSSNTSLVPGVRFDSVPHLPGGDVWANFDQPYLNFVGFFTSMYLTITIFTLMVACIDRLVYVRNSRTYSNQRSTFVAKIAIATSWVVAIIVAIVPFFVDRYNLIASVMVLSSGATSLYLYIIGYVIPLVVLWVGGIVLLILTIIRSRKIATEAQTEQEAQTRTMQIMMGVFSLNLLIGLLSAGGSFFLDNIDHASPTTLDQNAASTFSSFEFVAILFIVSNSLWNFFVHLGQDARFKSALTSCACSAAATPGVLSPDSPSSFGMKGTNLGYTNSSMVGSDVMSSDSAVDK